MRRQGTLEGGSRTRKRLYSVCSRGGMRLDQMPWYGGQNLRRSYPNARVSGPYGLWQQSPPHATLWLRNCNYAMATCCEGDIYVISEFLMVSTDNSVVVGR